MTEILMYTKTGTKIFNAVDILEHVNDQASIAELQAMNWANPKSKKDFLMGKNTSLQAEIAKPLTEEEADKALEEYYYRLKN